MQNWQEILSTIGIAISTIIAKEIIQILTKWIKTPKQQKQYLKKIKIETKILNQKQKLEKKEKKWNLQHNTKTEYQQSHLPEIQS